VVFKSVRTQKIVSRDRRNVRRKKKFGEFLARLAREKKNEIAHVEGPSLLKVTGSKVTESWTKSNFFMNVQNVEHPPQRGVLYRNIAPPTNPQSCVAGA